MLDGELEALTVAAGETLLRVPDLAVDGSHGVDDVLRGRTQDLSVRSLQRRFLHVTGLTYKTIQQIDRARQAMTMLQEGRPIVDVVYEAGYFDQPHLTRSMKLFMGQTPSEIAKSG